MAGVRYPIMPAGKGLPVVHAPEAASQSFKAGAPLKITGGKVAVWAAPGDNMVGFATHGASGTTDADVAYVACEPGAEFEFSLDKASDLGNLALLVTHLDTEFGLTAGAEGIWYVDVDKTTSNGVVKVMSAVTPIGTRSDAPGGIRVRGYVTLDQTTYEAS